MRKRALALWPKKFKEEQAQPPPELWVQEEEVLKLELEKNQAEHPKEKVQRLLTGFDLKRWIL